MQEVNNRYREIYTDFEALIGYAITISSAVGGRATSVASHLYAAPIFGKLVCHAVTLRRISPTGITPTTRGASEIWDLSSVCVIARAIIEAYDALSYVAVHDVDEHERSFRILLWELHDQERRQKMLSLIGSSAPAVREIDESLVRLRNQLVVHPMFANATKDLINKVRGGNTPPFHLSHSIRNELSGVNHEYYNAAVMFLSSYVHTYPFSVHQLMHFRAGDPGSLRLISVALQYATGFLAKGIEGMNAVFGSDCPSADEAVQSLLDTWLGTLEQGIRTSSQPSLPAVALPCPLILNATGTTDFGRDRK